MLLFLTNSKKPKEPLNYKIRKKVSFNLNVQTYEPILKEDNINHFWEIDEEEKKEETSKETAKESQTSSLSDGNSTAMKMASFPSNYRYRNCIDSYSEEDEIAFEESDLDDDDDDYGGDWEEEEEDDDDNDGNIDDLRISQEEFSKQFNSLSVTSQLAEDKTKHLKPLGDSNEGGLKLLGLNRNARDRSQYVHSVLNPVENLRQWRAVKARKMPLIKHQRKENVAIKQQPQKPFSSTIDFSQSTPLMQEIAVDASLSNWLVSPDSYQPKTASITKVAEPLLLRPCHQRKAFVTEHVHGEIVKTCLF